jgi:hypothetical protein
MGHHRDAQLRVGSRYTFWHLEAQTRRIDPGLAQRILNVGG